MASHESTFSATLSVRRLDSVNKGQTKGVRGGGCFSALCNYTFLRVYDTIYTHTRNENIQHFLISLLFNECGHIRILTYSMICVHIQHT